MSSGQTTTFDNKASILSEIWVNYRGNEEFNDFIEYNDLGLPLSYLISTGVVEAKSEQARAFVEETFSLLLAGLEVEDTGFETLDSILDLE